MKKIFVKTKDWVRIQVINFGYRCADPLPTGSVCVCVGGSPMPKIPPPPSTKHLPLSVHQTRPAITLITDTFQPHTHVTALLPSRNLILSIFHRLPGGRGGIFSNYPGPPWKPDSFKTIWPPPPDTPPPILQGRGRRGKGIFFNIKQQMERKRGPSK